MEQIRSQQQMAPIWRSFSEPNLAANDTLNITPTNAASPRVVNTAEPMDSAQALQRSYSLNDIPTELIQLNTLTASSNDLSSHNQDAASTRSRFAGAIMGTLAFGSRAIVTTAKTSFNALNSVRQGVSRYIENNQFADTHKLLDLKDNLEQFKDQKARKVSTAIEMRSAATQNQVIQLEKLTPTIAKLPEVQRALAKCTQELTKHMQWGRSVRKLETQARQDVSELIQRPLHGQMTKAQISLETLQADLNGVADTLNGNEEAFSTQIQEINTITELAQSLERNRAEVKTLGSALHLNTRWSDWSACFRALSEYCVQTDTPVDETLASQAQVAETVSTALRDLVTLQREVQQLSHSNSLLGDKLAQLPKQTPASGPDTVLTKSQLQRTQQLFQDIEKKLASATALAQNTVSFFNRQPTQSMQKSTLEFATQLQNTIHQLRSSTVTLTQGQVQNYRLSTQAMGELLQDNELIQAVAV